jgi:hypothetical protein
MIEELVLVDRKAKGSNLLQLRLALADRMEMAKVLLLLVHQTGIFQELLLVDRTAIAQVLLLLLDQTAKARI